MERKLTHNTETKNSGNETQIKGHLGNGSNISLKDLFIEVYDESKIIKNPLAIAKPDEKGDFLTRINYDDIEPFFSGRTPKVYFTVRTDKQRLYSSKKNVTATLKPKTTTHVKIQLPESFEKSAKKERFNLNIKELLKTSGISKNSMGTYLARLKKQGISNLEDLFTHANKLTPDLTGLSQKACHEILTLGKLATITPSLSLKEKLLKQGFYSVREIANLPMATFEKKLGRLKKSEKEQLAQMRRQAKIIAEQVKHYAISEQKKNSPDATWHLPDDVRKPSKKETCHVCKGCENIFSPLAYLFDLLDLIWYRWSITTNTLEKILLQSIDGIHCETGFEMMLQAELASEFLEKYLGPNKIPVTDTSFRNTYRNSWKTLLGITDADLNTITTPANAIPSTPGLTLLQKLKLLISTTKPQLATLREIRNLLNEKNNIDLEQFSFNYRDTTGQFAKRLMTVYNETVISYRDTLIKKTDTDVLTLQNKLFIDLQTGPCHQTNRITQLILSLQSFILSIRTGEIANISRSDLAANTVQFDELTALPVEETRWKWLKDYQSWASALYAVLYTENVLLPKMNGGSERFQEAVKKLQGPVTPKQVRQIYLDFRFPKLSEEQNFQDILLSLYDEDQETIPHDELLRLFMRPPYENRLIELGDWVKKLEVVATQAIQDYTDETGFIFLIQLHDELERLFYLPLLIAWTLNQSGEYAAAYDWYRLLYNPEKPSHERLVFDFHTYFSDEALYSSEWFNGGLDPEEIAQRRRGVYLRHTILAMVKNIVDWADHEFALGTAETRDRARDLYELAARILQAPDLADHCGQAIRELELSIVTNIKLRPELDKTKLKELLEELYTVRNRLILDEAIEDCKAYLEGPPEPGNIDPIEKIIKRAVKKDRTSREKPLSLSKEIISRRTTLEEYENDFFYSGNYGKAISHEMHNPPLLPTHDNMIKTPRFSDENWTFSHYEEVPVYSSLTFCVPPNPLLQAYSFYIEANLLKLRFCLNLAGYPAESAALSEETTTNFLDNIADAVQIQPDINYLGIGSTDQPRYRYSFLIEKARQCIEIGQRLGQALLQAYEKRDSETFAQLQASQAIELAKSTISLKQLSVREAEYSLDIAGTQEKRAEFQLDWWKDRIENGFMSFLETAGVGLMLGSAALQATAAVVQGIGAIIAFFGAGAAGTVGGAAAGGTGGGVAGGAPAVPGAAAGGTAGAAAGFSFGAALAAAVPGTAGALNSAAGALGTLGSASLTVAGFERRWEEWNLQRDLADFDLQIANVQKKLSKNRILIANKELQISNLHQAQTQEVLEFLQNKFSNEQLYLWMIQVLSQNYRIIMQIATSLSRMAQSALEFERQEKVQIILGDYWSLNNTALANSELSEEQKQSGILGAERLMTDIAKLDAFKLQTDKRKLQLSKTISLAQMMPGDLVELRSSGKITFNTLLQWFDMDFPGHYLRLIKNVRISVLALIPPVQGIHAMLSNSGESTVVVKKGLEFQKKRASRNFGESIALDSPFNDTGLFVLDYQDPMFLPFEGLGVETQWTFELPRASNPFNFDTIVDVLFTIEYTALHDALYAEQVRQELGDSISHDLILDLHHQYPDPWYHFKNPTPAETSNSLRSIKVTIPPQLLPANIKKGPNDVSTRHLSVIAVGDFKDLTVAEEAELQKAFTVSKGTQVYTTDPNVSSGQQAFPTYQIDTNKNYVVFSTRNAGEPNGMIANAFNPTGDWEVTVNAIQFQNDTLMNRLGNIILVATIDGKLEHH
ncbi:hypothetical protein E3983_07155 [Legionella israelensis]|uniref:Tc toxin complex TcA C-terminal TcB-binding domain-containing protein n=1 Tax=Legionella israelensis TaxID=454 RepID=A0AAX1EGD7_9GAMM|nr:neuraminidase-like domain-containing protein [Legionella israelensis]QBR84155.1 hypothetical protein E3983_07155 [Legionella israelensis]